MSTTPYVIQNFRGLRLDVDPQELGLNGAVDLLNVDFDRPGMVRTRFGSQKWSGTAISAVGYQATLPVADAQRRVHPRSRERRQAHRWH
jgi:hypothetical protein